MHNRYRAKSGRSPCRVIGNREDDVPAKGQASFPGLFSRQRLAQQFFADAFEVLQQRSWPA